MPDETERYNAAEGQEKQQRPVLVEIGPQGFPIRRIAPEVEEKIEKGAIYIGIEASKKELESTWKADDVPHLVGGDIQNLPLKDASVNELWLMNVFSGFVRKPTRIDPNGTLHYELGSDRIFQEFARVIKPGGIIYIGEYYPPSFKGNLQWLADVDYDEFGLEKKVYSGENFYHFLKQHDMRLGIDVDEGVIPFFVVLRRRENL